MGDVWVWIVAAALWSTFGAAGALIAEHKERPRGEGFLLGFLLGGFGLAIAAMMSRGLPDAPPGMLALWCPRCTAPQNIDDGEATFICWRCDYESSVDEVLAKN